MKDALFATSPSQLPHSALHPHTKNTAKHKHTHVELAGFNSVLFPTNLSGQLGLVSWRLLLLLVFSMCLCAGKFKTLEPESEECLFHIQI